MSENARSYHNYIDFIRYEVYTWFLLSTLIVSLSFHKRLTWPTFSYQRIGRGVGRMFSYFPFPTYVALVNKGLFILKPPIKPKCLQYDPELITSAPWEKEKKQEHTFISVYVPWMSLLELRWEKSVGFDGRLLFQGAWVSWCCAWPAWSWNEACNHIKNKTARGWAVFLEALSSLCQM